MFLIAFDSAGFLLGFSKYRNKTKFAHIAHLSGILFGVWYFKYGHGYLWQSKKNIVHKWREIRPKKE